MALSNFQKDIARAKTRQGSVFVDDGGTWRDLGQVANVELTWEPVASEPDTAGRTKMLAADVTVTFVMQQTSDQELAALNLLAGEGSTNGRKIKVTEKLATAMTAGTTDGYTFNNVLGQIAGQIRFTGEASQMTYTATGRVPLSELIKLGTTKTLTFDANA